MERATDQAEPGQAGPRADSPRASTAWSIPEIRVVKDDRCRLRIDQADPATYGAYAARQFLATADADPRYREGMTKRPSSSAIRITYLDVSGDRREIGVREIFCRMDGDALVLTQIEDSEGEKLRDLPIGVPAPCEPVAPPVAQDDADEDEDEDHADRFHELALAELGEAPPPTQPAITEPEPEAPRPEPPRERRLPTGPLRQYNEPADSAPTAVAPKAPASAGPSSSGSVSTPSVARAPGMPAGAPAGLAVRALDENEAASLRALIEAKAGQARWASGLLMQAAERYSGDRKQQNQYLTSLLRVSIDPSRPESQTPLAAALRSVLEEVQAYKGGVLDRDPLKAEKLALQPFVRSALAPPPSDDDQIKTVSGTAQRTPAQVLAKLEDPKLARATRVKLLLEIVPEMIESWRPDKESGRSEAGNENSPAIVRRLYSVANEQRQQRKFIDDGAAFKKANERYAVLEGRLPKASTADES